MKELSHSGWAISSKCYNDNGATQAIAYRTPTAKRKQNVYALRFRKPASRAISISTGRKRTDHSELQADLETYSGRSLRRRKGRGRRASSRGNTAFDDSLTNRVLGRSPPRARVLVSAPAFAMPFCFGRYAVQAMSTTTDASDRLVRDFGLISLDEACRRAALHAKPIERVERVPIVDAINRVLAEEVRAKIALPPSIQSAMDGYAFAAASIEESRTRTFHVAIRVAAGSRAPTPCRWGSAAPDIHWVSNSGRRRHRRDAGTCPAARLAGGRGWAGSFGQQHPASGRRHRARRASSRRWTASGAPSPCAACRPGRRPRFRTSSPARCHRDDGR